MKYIITIILCYLIGCISGSYILGKYVAGLDIREHGSGNAGTTNAMRVMGEKLGSLTLLIDVVKAIVAVMIAKHFLGPDYFLLGGVAVILGHDFPFYMNFKGGKGAASTLGVFLSIDLRITIISVMIGVIVALLTKYMSLASMVFAISGAILFAMCGCVNDFNFACIVFLVILCILRHHENIKRLYNGTENKISFLV